MLKLNLWYSGIHVECFLCPLGLYHKIKEDLLPQIMDWIFLLLLGIAMAMLSFVLDYLIEKAGEGELIV